ncbi:MAG: tetratricopeptide repeat protein [Bacteroidales bacterium]|nr:tetratricopeptide repeat protein [Bacteroidales bacterium]
MNIDTIQKSYNEINTCIYNKELNKAFSYLEKAIGENNIGILNNELYSQRSIYENMLKYSFGYGNDPNRNEQYLKLCHELHVINDKLRLEILKNNQLDLQSQLGLPIQTVLSSDIETKMELVQEIERIRDISSLLKESGNSATSEEQRKELAGHIENLFYVLLFTDYYHEDEIRLTQSIISSKKLFKEDKLVLVSGLFLSLLMVFDENKCKLLFEFYDQNEDHVWQRALLSLLIAMLVYQDRLYLYPNIENRLKSTSGTDDFNKRSERILLQFLKSRDTERISKKIQEEIIPEVMKMRHDLEDKLKLNDLLSEKNFEDKNPDWQEMFSDTPDVYEKFEEFSNMQLEGNDVFMSAFSMLKNFPFFSKLPNWFQPFDRHQGDVAQMLEKLDKTEKLDTFLEGIENSSIMCNSDKYSFCFNIQFVPEMQQNLMMEMFNMEMKAMNEMEKEEAKHNIINKEQVIFTQYFQDLYRFFKLHPLHHQFIDIFKMPVDFTKSYLFKLMFDNTDTLRKLGEFYFAKDYFEEAIQIFEYINRENSSLELLEKIGFSYQKINNFKKAVEYYEQAEILETQKLWLLKKIAFCYRKIGNYAKAVSYYEKIINQEPDNIENHLYLGHLNIDLANYDKALQYYFKVEYDNPDNIKVLRPIGWCYYITVKYDKAVNYFQKVNKLKNAGKNDYLNLGHAYWSAGKTTEMIDAYRKAYELSKYDNDWLKKVFTSDSKYIMNSGIDEIEIHLITDYIILTTGE